MFNNLNIRKMIKNAYIIVFIMFLIWSYFFLKKITITEYLKNIYFEVFGIIITIYFFNILFDYKERKEKKITCDYVYDETNNWFISIMGTYQILFEKLKYVENNEDYEYIKDIIEDLIFYNDRIINLLERFGDLYEMDDRRNIYDYYRRLELQIMELNHIKTTPHIRTNLEINIKLGERLIEDVGNFLIEKNKNNTSIVNSLQIEINNLIKEFKH